MAARLDRSASGARHARWVGEITITMRSHEKINIQLTPELKEILGKECTIVEARNTDLMNAVNPYRQFIESAFSQVRADQRVANFMCDEAMRETRGTLMVKRSEVDKALEGGLSGLFGSKGFAASLRAGHERTVEIVLNAGSKVGTLPPHILGPGKAEALADRLTTSGTRLRGCIDQMDREIEPKRRPLRAAVEIGIGRVREALEQMDGRLRSHFSAEFIESLYPQLSKGGKSVAADADEEDDDSDPPEAAKG